MAKTRRLVLDVLKPHKPNMVRMADDIADLPSVSSVNFTLYEVDEKVENIKCTVIGNDLDLDKIQAKIDELGGSVHSVDEVVSGKKLLDEVKTPQDE